MGMNGADIIIYIDGEAVGSQRDCSLDEASATVDFSSKDSRAQIVDYGRYSATLTLDALYVPTDAAYQALRDAIRNATKVEVVRVEENVVLESAQAVVTALGTKAPDQVEATVSASLTISGEWVSGS